GAAGVGDNGKAIALGPGLLGEDFGHVKQVGDLVHAQYAAALEGGFEDVVRAGERTGVGGGGFGGAFSPARFDDDDRLSQRHFAGGREEAARVADRLHVDDDALRVGIIPEVADEVAPADVEHGTDGNECTETDHFPQRPVEHGGTKG